MNTSQIHKKLVASHYASKKKAFDDELYFFPYYRIISFWPSAVCIKYGISANAVTAVGAALLLTSFIIMASGELLLGATLYLIAYILDLVDGNLARHSGAGSQFGWLIDGLVDSLTFLIFIAIAIGNSIAGRALFSADLEIYIGVLTAFGFLFRCYFYIRKAYALKAIQVDTDESVIGKPTQLSQRGYVLKKCKRIYYALISGMPILLIFSCLFKLESLYLAIYFVLFVPGTLFELVYGLRSIYIKESSI